MAADGDVEINVSRGTKASLRQPGEITQITDEK